MTKNGSRSVVSDSLQPHGGACQTSLSMEFSRQEYWSGQPFPSPGILPNPGIEPRSPALWADSLTAEPERKPKNTGVGKLSLLQKIFPTQELNQGLLHCRKILYQLSYWGSPMLPMKSDRYIFCFSLLSAESALSLSFTVKSLAPPSASLNWWSKLLTPLLLKPQFPMKVFI